MPLTFTQFPGSTESKNGPRITVVPPPTPPGVYAGPGENLMTPEGLHPLEPRRLFSGNVFGVGDVTTVDNRPALVVLTDIGGDVDDEQSLTRLLSYANEFDLRGILVGAQGTPGDAGRLTDHEGDGQTGDPDATRAFAVINAYANAYPRLNDAATGGAGAYPSPAQLRSVVVEGLGRAADGTVPRDASSIRVGNNSAASDRLIEIVNASNVPVNVSIFGGARELAQALFDADRGPTINIATFVSKLRVYSIDDQDVLLSTAAGPNPNGTLNWIVNRYPDLLLINSGNVGDEGASNTQSQALRGFYRNTLPGVNGGGNLVNPSDFGLTGQSFVNDLRAAGNPSIDGDLSDFYPTRGYNGEAIFTAPNTGSVIVKEGDTPSFLYFLPNGLSDPDDPSLGGFGGRFEQLNPNVNYWTPARDFLPSGNTNAFAQRQYTIARFRSEVQNDFLGQLSNQQTGAGDQAPTAVLSINESAGDRTQNVLYENAAQGSTLTLDASRSFDPDGETLGYRWFVYDEPSSFSGTATFSSDRTGLTSLSIEGGRVGETLHVIVAVDEADGNGATLTAFRRVVLEVSPAETPAATPPVEETPVVETPVVETPVVETPVVTTPVVETPVVETPVVTTPVVETPVVETPAVTPPVVETPIVETPVFTPPVVETPVVETPVVTPPVVETPVVETPAATPPVVETPVVETPAATPPVVETPVATPPAVETPVVETPAVTPPVVETPVVAAPIFDSPTPVVKTPEAAPLTTVNPIDEGTPATEANFTPPEHRTEVGARTARDLRTLSGGVESGLLSGGTFATSHNIAAADFYRVQVETGDVLDVALTKTGGGVSALKVQLYFAAEDGGPLTYIDEAFEIGRLVGHRQVADADGFYYLSVNSASLASSAEVRYKLEWGLEAESVRTLDRESDVFEGFGGNDTFEAARDLRSLSSGLDRGLIEGTTVDADGSTDDRDWFRIDLQAGDRVRVELSHAANETAEMFLQFLVADNTVAEPQNLGNLYVEGPDTLGQEFTATTTGTYYLLTGSPLVGNTATVGYVLEWEVL